MKIREENYDLVAMGNDLQEARATIEAMKKEAFDQRLEIASLEAKLKYVLKMLGKGEKQLTNKWLLNSLKMIYREDEKSWCNNCQKQVKTYAMGHACKECQNEL